MWQISFVRPNPKHSSPAVSGGGRDRSRMLLLLASLTFIGASCTVERPAIQADSAPTSAASAGGGSALSSTTTTEPSATPATTSTTQFEATDYELSVVSQGAEPRFQVLLGTEPDSTNQLVLDDNKALIISVADSPPEPPVVTRASTDIDVVVYSVNNDRITVRSTIGQTDIDERTGPRWALNDLAQNMASIEGLWIDQTSDIHLNKRVQEIQPGLNELSTVETLTGFADALALAQIPIPPEDLGQGAIWTTSIQTLTGGLPATVSSRATITDINDRVAIAEVEIIVDYHLGDIRLSNGPATLLTGSTQLLGQLSWSSTVPFALYELQSTSDLTMRLEDANEAVSQFSQNIQRTYSLQLR